VEQAEQVNSLSACISSSTSSVGKIVTRDDHAFAQVGKPFAGLEDFVRLVSISASDGLWLGPHRTV